MHRRPSLRLVRPIAVATALGALLAVPALAHGATTVEIVGGELRILAAANAANSIVVDQTASAYRVSDTGDDVPAVAPCNEVTENVVACPEAGVTSIRAELGNQDDFIAVEGPTPSDLFGQQGVDVLLGSNGDDTLDAGPGRADYLGGRGGNDTLLALNATGSVRLIGNAGDDELRGNDAPGDANLAFPPVGPFLFSATPLFAGGDGNDTIVGSNTADAIFGGPGADTMNGGTGGADIGFYHDRVEDLNVDLTAGGTTDGGPSDQAVVEGTPRRDSLTGVEGVVGGAGGDELTGTVAANAIIGGGGNDVIHGLAGADALCGEGGAFISTEPDSFFFGGGQCFSSFPSGNNVLNGGSGDDTLSGGFGRDRMNGGADVDAASWADRSLPLRVTAEDQCSGSPCAKNNDGQLDADPFTAGNQPENDTVGLDVEELVGGSGDDFLAGSPQANRLDGAAGSDELVGGGGGDVLCGDGATFFLGAPVFRGQLCNTTSVGGADKLDGGTGADELVGGRGPDRLDGGDGDDTAAWYERSEGVKVTIEDVCSGSPCADNNDGQVDVDTGTAGNQGEHDRVLLTVENLIGSQGPDLLAGSSGPNIIMGFNQTDDLRGLAGADVLEPNGGTGDIVDGGGGRDFVSYRNESNNMNVSLDNVANDGSPVPNFSSPFNQNVHPDVEGIMGSVFSDTLTGQADGTRNTLLGYGGNDTLQGLGGPDLVDGGGGQDSMKGGTGNDLLMAADRVFDVLIDCDDGASPGGGGSDRAVFDDVIESTTNCETQNGVAIMASAGAVADPRTAAFAARERRLLALHRRVDQVRKARRAQRRARAGRKAN